MNCTCPHCASGQTQRLAIIYTEGTLRTRSRSMQTAASFLAAPPKPMGYFGPSVVLFLGFLVLGDVALGRLPHESWLAGGVLGNTLQAAFVFAPVLAWIILARRYNGSHWREQIGRWERSFRCSRCGEVFLVPHHREAPFGRGSRS